jgi:hypothetical protein
MIWLFHAKAKVVTQRRKAAEQQSFLIPAKVFAALLLCAFA